MNSYSVVHASAQKIIETTKSLKIVCNNYDIHFNIVCQQTEMMHQQWVSCSGSRVIERAVGEWRQRPLFAVLSTCCNPQDVMWHVWLFEIIISVTAVCLCSVNHFWANTCYPVWIHCCKWPNHDFCISQGSVVTVLKWVGQNYSSLRQVLSWWRAPKIIKIGQCFAKLFKK